MVSGADARFWIGVNGVMSPFYLLLTARVYRRIIEHMEAEDIPFGIRRYPLAMVFFVGGGLGMVL